MGCLCGHACEEVPTTEELNYYKMLRLAQSYVCSQRWIQVKCLAPQEVVPAQERGIVVLDIRPKKEYDEVMWNCGSCDYNLVCLCRLPLLIFLHRNEKKICERKHAQNVLIATCSSNGFVSRSTTSQTLSMSSSTARLQDGKLLAPGRMVCSVPHASLARIYHQCVADSFRTPP